MSILRFKPDATSPTIGSILMVAITIVLALLVLLLFHMPSLDYDMTPIPQVFIITAIYDVDEITGLLNYDSRVILSHSGTLDYPNGNLKAVFLKNGQPVSCVIDTMNGHDFISTSHFGVQWMGGAGCSGNLWAPGEMIAIDFTDDTFRPGDTVQVDIMDNTTSQTISRHVYHAT